jgi:EAL domain-containing protein (putative c-di-GMP-specific phosphodiesterase class I)
MHESALHRLETEAELRRALEREKLEIHYQPVVSLHDGEVCSVEALLRWRHPERGLLSPAEFLDVAEDSGLIVPIGVWVLQRACADAHAWRPRPRGAPIGLCVNVSARQLLDPGLLDAVASALETGGLDPGRLTLEITESVLMEDADLAALRLRELKALGVRLAIDDFGTGYSSLSYLRTFPVDVLKIDRSFVAGVAGDLEGACFVQAIVRLAQVLGLDTVAEGVEEIEQLSRIAELDCDMAQGFLFSRPVPVADLDFEPPATAAPSPVDPVAPPAALSSV